MTTHPSKSTPTKNDNPKPTPTLGVVETPNPVETANRAASPEPPATEAPTSTKKESEPTRPYTITVPVRTLKLVQIISKTEGVSASDIWLDAIDKSGLKERAKAALAAMQADLGE